MSSKKVDEEKERYFVSYDGIVQVDDEYEYIEGYFTLLFSAELTEKEIKEAAISIAKYKLAQVSSCIIECNINHLENDT